MGTFSWLKNFSHASVGFLFVIMPSSDLKESITKFPGSSTVVKS